MRTRYLESAVLKDLEKKMAFFTGLRQVGKTTFSKLILSDEKGYLNWDIPGHREQILRREYPAVPMLVFDEIHKFINLRNSLKGYYDQFNNI